MENMVFISRSSLWGRPGVGEGRFGAHAHSDDNGDNNDDTDEMMRRRTWSEVHQHDSSQFLTCLMEILTMAAL